MRKFVLDPSANDSWVQTKHQKLFSPVQRFPARVTGDGNCLFNACSLHMVKNEQLATMLRMLTCIELFLNANYYANHDVFHETFKNGKFKTYNSVFAAAVSNNILLPNQSNESYVKNTAMELIFSGVYTPFLALLGLSNVIQSSIKLYCKDISDERLVSLYNCTILPKPDRNNNETIYLFWTSVTSNDVLNHFLLLVAESLIGTSSNYDKRTVLIRKPLPDNVLKEIFVKIGTKRKSENLRS